MREDTKEALFALKKKGIRIFISTGRHMQDIRTAKGDLLEGVPFDGYVLINGQYCIAGEKQQVIHKHPIPASDIKSLVELLRTTPFPVSYTHLVCSALWPASAMQFSGSPCFPFQQRSAVHWRATAPF